MDTKLAKEKLEVDKKKAAVSYAALTSEQKANIEALEEQVVVLRLMGEVAPSTVLVSIGEENAHEGFTGASVVSVGYGSAGGTADLALGGLGVVGPTRMDYPGTMAAVRAVARYVGQLLAES